MAERVTFEISAQARFQKSFVAHGRMMKFPANWVHYQGQPDCSGINVTQSSSIWLISKMLSRDL